MTLKPATRWQQAAAVSVALGILEYLWPGNLPPAVEMMLLLAIIFFVVGVFGSDT